MAFPIPVIRVDDFCRCFLDNHLGSSGCVVTYRLNSLAEEGIWEQLESSNPWTI